MTKEFGSIASTSLARETNRREFLEFGAALLAATTATGMGIKSVLAAGNGGFGAGKVVFNSAAHHVHDEAGTPVPGLQADGTTLWRVQVAQMDMENKLDAQGFYPREITINPGDSIWFDGQMPGFHSVTFPEVGAEPYPVLIPDPDAGTPAEGAPPAMILNPQLAFPSSGTTFDGTALVNSGIDVLRDVDAGPFIATFTAPGTFGYFCVPHQIVMNATVIVQEAGSELPYDQEEYDTLAAEQIAQVFEEAKAEKDKYAEAAPGEAGSGVDWIVSAGAGEGQGRVMAFLPGELTIKAGQTVRWVVRSVGEPHTVTFLGGGDGQGADFNMVPVENGPPKLVPNPAVWGPVGGNVYNGEGYLNSGVFDKTFNTDTFDLKFDTPGSYDYICVLHPMMVAKVIVEE
jgi:plastocyanin